MPPKFVFLIGGIYTETDERQVLEFHEFSYLIEPCLNWVVQ